MRRAILTASAAGAALLLSSCSAALPGTLAASHHRAAAVASASPAPVHATTPAQAPRPVPAPRPAPAPRAAATRPAAIARPRPAPALPAGSTTPAAAASPAGYPVVSPPGGTPWTWPQGTPASCTASESGSSGTFVQAILIENQGADTPWNGQSADLNSCFAYTLGTISFSAETVQVLIRDTEKGVQKAFTGHLGDVIRLGRFTVKVDPPNSAYGSSVVFEVDIYWA